jgi:APA family basic amino acid/polyamine antiporter
MSHQHFVRRIGFFSATSIVIGSVIGSAIFMKPATMAAQLGSPVLMIIVWVIAGIISLFGAMAFAELGTMFPETGGQYVYLQQAFGDKTAYLYGWSSIAVVNTAAIAAIAYVLASYLEYFFPLPRLSEAMEMTVILKIPLVGEIRPLQNIGVKAVAIAVIMGLSIINYFSLRSGNAIQFAATAVKIGIILLLVVGILFSGKGEHMNLVSDSVYHSSRGWDLLTAFMAATTGAFAAYDGWNNLNMVAGEIREPERNINRSLVAGLWACILIYVLVTLSYMYVLPIDVMAKSKLVASDAADVVMGSNGAAVIAILIVISTFGATNVNLLANARVVFAMSGSGDFFSWAGKVHPRHDTPGNAVILLGIWSSILVLSGSFDILSDMFIFMSWVFYGLVVTGVFILRRKQPGKERPYKTWGYPIIPLIFLAFTIVYVCTTLYSDISNFREGRTPVVNSVFGLMLTLSGMPLFYYFRRKKNVIVTSPDDQKQV